MHIYNPCHLTFAESPSGHSTFASHKNFINHAWVRHPSSCFVTYSAFTRSTIQHGCTCCSVGAMGTCRKWRASSARRLTRSTSPTTADAVCCTLPQTKTSAPSSSSAFNKTWVSLGKKYIFHTHVHVVKHDSILDTQMSTAPTTLATLLCTVLWRRGQCSACASCSTTAQTRVFKTTRSPLPSTRPSSSTSLTSSR